MVTVARMKQLIPVTDESIARLLSISNPEIINERIVADIIMQIRFDENLLEFCELFEQIIDPPSRVYVEIFRSGKYICLNCLYVHMYVHYYLKL